ncbi:hypothetical protein P256_00412 [Acinetobacter nectaris CIP 110549]|uniref:GST N-terminal domain-containing protein n=1 Tax=Acinetobacter nectaris CIP 110549 TaxID=1392540 RepID=V2TBH5_9GAMM|nr:glutathione S-transferase family protein [Acinetobacter nectaris]ESK39973.1 hypothetical protein P256_00412 [Acinetobacter nectaris CIP 110549]
MRILYQFPLSHFCEKARWLLDYKELDYVAQNLTPIVHRAFSRLKTKQNTLPILKDNDLWIHDSTKIAEYLDEIYPEKILIPQNRSLKESIYNFNNIANELGEHVRRWTLQNIILIDQKSIDNMINERGYLRKFEKYSKPVLKKLISQSLHLSDEQMKYDHHRIIEIIEMLNIQLKNAHKGYLVGEHLTLADISICSMLAPLMNIYGTPWEIGESKQSQELLDMQMFIQSTAIGQYVQRIYNTERNARIDWRGI